MENKTSVLRLRISPEEKKHLEHVAEICGISISQYTRMLIEKNKETIRLMEAGLYRKDFYRRKLNAI